MKKYEIEINDEIYRVSIKELSEDSDMSVGKNESESTAQTTPGSASQPVTSAEGTEVNAPMSGTILKVNVTAGQSVSQGDTLVVLEAMKMENEIVAPSNGTVGEVFVNPNDRVESNQILLTI